VSEDVLSTYRSIEKRLISENGAFCVEQVMRNGRATKVYRHRATDIGSILAEAERAHAGKVLIWETGRTSTYAEVFERGHRLAAGLRDHHGVGRGTAVGLAMRNCTEWFEAFIAIQRLGAVAVLFNSRNAADELAAAAADVRCAIILADDARAGNMLAGGVATPVIAFEGMRKLIEGAGEAAPQAAVDSEAAAVVIFTSGTTGRPKGAVLNQFNLTNLAQNLAYSQAINMELAATLAGISLERLLAGRSPMSNLLVAPLFHISGLSVFLITLANGGMISIMRRWDPDAALAVIEENRVTSFTGPPLVLTDLVARPGAAEKLATIGNFSIAGQATPKGLIDKVRGVLPRVAPGVGWGGTETCGSTAAASGPMFLLSPDSAGVPLPISEISIRDDNGVELPLGEPGEIWVRGALIMQGYWHNSEATAAAIEDGWYKSGDIGTLDERGFIKIVDRKKDMVISAGENIYCAEVERVLGSDPAVAEVAVFGVPDPRLGEKAIAAVNLHAGATLSEDDLKAYARKYLADYKVPSAIAMNLGPLPRNLVGKVEKPKLRALYLAQVEATS
jgi:acyl-CoA synthetase (AMP-forming)/AMP-acid ligase II